LNKKMETPKKSDNDDTDNMETVKNLEL